jgi:hypothetical protein
MPGYAAHAIRPRHRGEWHRAPALVALALVAGCGLLRHRDLPTHLVGFNQTFVVRGDAGLTQVLKLHGTRMNIQSGAFAIYGGGAVSLWVAGARDTVVAERLVRDMSARLRGEDSPFRPESTRTLQSRRILELSGMGQRHFCFRAGSRVVWLAANRREADAALEEALRFYR